MLEFVWTIMEKFCTTSEPIDNIDATLICGSSIVESQETKQELGPAGIVLYAELAESVLAVDFCRAGVLILTKAKKPKFKGPEAPLPRKYIPSVSAQGPPLFNITSVGG